MKQKLLSLVFVLTLCIGVSYAQNRQVSGRVTSATDGAPISGASVSVVGTSTATQTDGSGNYSISVSNGSVLNFSYLGYEAQRITVTNQAVINVQLVGDAESLEEVVVTAMGITRSEKSLGYSATKVDGEELAKSRNTNLTNALAGKVAGVQIASTSSDPGAATSVIIRGFSSLNSSNQPLYVVDGVPLQNSTFQSDGKSTMLNGISNISSDDVENITILKGAAATALYGSRAANGVVVITTKKGEKGESKNYTIQYNGGLQLRQVSYLPEFQNEFGQGWDGQQTYIENGSWGPRLDGSQQLYGPIWNNQQLVHAYSAKKNNVKDFFDIGVSNNHHLSFSGVSEDSKLDYYLSYSNTSDDGMIPTDADSYKRNTIGYRSSYAAAEWLKLSSSVNFANARTNSVGSFQGTSVIDGLYELPRDVSIVDMQDIKSPFFSPEAYFTPYGITNPYWSLANNFNQQHSKQLFGKLQVDIKPIEKIGFTYRFGFDYGDYDVKIGEPRINLDDALIDENYGYPPASMNQAGSVYARYGRNYELNHDFMATYDNTFSDISLTALAGVNLNERYSTYMFGQTKRRLVGLFGDVTLGYRDMLFLNLTARNDWSSTLPLNANSYFYPGSTLSWVFSNMIEDRSVLSFGKLRVAYGKTGNDANPYLTLNRYIQAVANGYYAGSIADFPLNGVNSFLLSTTAGSLDLSPEMSTEFEVGADLRFLNNRIGLDFAYYNKLSSKQIFTLPIDPSTGFNNLVTNFGDVRNKGIELLLSTTPVKSEKFRWDVDFNFNINRSKVESLPESLEDGLVNIESFSAGSDAVYMRAVVGKPLGVYYTYKQRYIDDPSSPYYGAMIVDAAGLPKKTTEVEDTGMDINHKWTGGISTSLSAYNFTLSALLDVRYGGTMFSRTKSLMQFTGNGLVTLYNDRNPFIVPNSVEEQLDVNGNVTGYVENTTPIRTWDDSYQKYFDQAGYGNQGMAYLLDKTFTKIRNITLAYNVPQKWVKSTRLNGITVSAFVNNPFMWTASDNIYIDPEGSTEGSDLGGQFGELYVNPSARIYGFNVNLKF
jgi:TonB-linked SusC/RagA family outer membrane protein